MVEKIESRAKLDIDKREFTGIVNNYSKSKIMTRNDGKSFVEIIPRETFKRALEKNQNPKLYINHQPYVDVSENIKLSAEEQGLVIRAKLSEKADNLFKAIKDEEFTSFSFGFKCLKDKWENDGDILVRTILDLDLIEISLLSIEPAYNGTKIVETRKFYDNELWKIDWAKKTIEIMKLF
ncbi:MAG: HK97 family phage prohead protease [Clostridium sp.]|uniref:HK97 family phage prohead protease n=1 Tax=Clostridium sp. TaxID=1506 RepID=UPI003F404E76